MAYQTYQGFIVGPPTAIAGVDTAFDDSEAILLQVNVGGDALSEAMPNKVFLNHITFVFTNSGAAEIQAQLFCDAACEFAISGQSAATTIAAVTGATDIGTSVEFKSTLTVDSNWTAPGRIYALIKTDTGSVTVKQWGTRAHWSVPR
tara:strand:+ start:65 stop:505 length:441 start_codon:yes stop_codon:yes gene_type:complete